jgi:glucose/arabinose dehydrogenase
VSEAIWRTWASPSWVATILLVGCGGSSGAATNGSDGGTVTGGDASIGTPADGGGPTRGDATTDVSVSDVATSDVSKADVAAPAEAAAPSPCSGAVHSVSPVGPTQPAPTGLTVPTGFAIETLAAIGAARQLAALPNGDLLVATSGGTVYLVPNAEADGLADKPVTFASIPDTPAQGIAFDAATCTVYVGAQHGVYAMKYVDGQLSATAGSPIAKVRQGSVTPGSDGDVHITTSVAVAGGALYVGVGSSCNACVEVDPTRATIQQMAPDGTGMQTRATRFRNAIALTVNPATGTLWAGGAGQDSLAEGHPYEFFDAVSMHPGVADYGWPACEENQIAYTTGADCSKTVTPLVELPAYATIIGAVFYPTGQTGSHAFGPAYRGGAFVTAHGSWHQLAGAYVTAPRVVYVPMNGDSPAQPVSWSNPTTQWTEFVGGFQSPDGTSRSGRPTGIAVGSQGSLFVADDLTGRVYRVRPM